MPISEPNLEPLQVEQQSADWPRSWATWFSEVWGAVRGWRRSYTATLTYDFGSINAQTQATQTVTVTGAAVGDAVLVRPSTAVNGLIIDGTVTAANVVTVRAANYSAGSINPASQVYTVICFQQ